MRKCCRGVYIAAALAALVTRVAANDHGQWSSLNDGCKNQLNNIWDKYYSLPITDGQYDCKSLLSGALNNTNGVGCPPYDNMIGCILVAPNAWINLYSNCSTLFSPPSNCVLNGFTGSDCKRPQYQSNNLLVAGDGESMYSVNSYPDSTGILDNNGPGWQTQFYVGEDADRRRRSLMQVEDNEGGGGGSGLDAGCWPDFYDVTDFTQWLDGVYQEPFYGGTSINPVGVIFWVLQAAGILSMALI